MIDQPTLVLLKGLTADDDPDVFDVVVTDGSHKVTPFDLEIENHHHPPELSLRFRFFCV